MKPLIPYIRQSRSKEKTISLTEQWDAIERWAKANGATLSVSSYADADAAGLIEQGVSGSKAWRERSLGRAIAECEARRASGIIVFDQSRLSREDLLGTAEVWHALDQAKADLIDATGGGKVNRMMYVVKSEMNRQQFETARDRGEHARRNAIGNGVHIGTTPVGYRRVGKGQPLEVDPDTAPAVQAAFAARAAGASWTQMAKVLTDGTGRRWSLKAAEHLSTSRTYLGEVRSGPFVKTGAHPALVKLALFEKVQSQRVQMGPRQRRKPGLLSGISYCATCQHRMGQDWNTRAGVKCEFYRCSNTGLCDARAVVMHRIAEPFVAEHVIDHYFGVFTKPSSPEDKTPELEAAVTAAEEELTAYLTAVQATTPGFGDGVRIRESALTEAREALGSYAPQATRPAKAVLVQLKEAAASDPAAAADQLRELAVQVIDRVEVQPGRWPIEQKVTVYWKDGSVTGRDAPTTVPTL
jgi:DNA invertase Pin-like site-specific DNA recombinase